MTHVLGQYMTLVQGTIHVACTRDNPLVHSFISTFTAIMASSPLGGSDRALDPIALDPIEAGSPDHQPRSDRRVFVIKQPVDPIGGNDHQCFMELIEFDGGVVGPSSATF